MERKSPLKSPEQLLAYRSLQELLAAKPAGVHAVAPTDSVFAALRSMADKQIGFLVVLDGGKLVGVFSERDYARKVELAGQGGEGRVGPRRDGRQGGVGNAGAHGTAVHGGDARQVVPPSAGGRERSG